MTVLDPLAVDAPRPEREWSPWSTHSAAFAAPPASRGDVLVVDDDEAVRRSLDRLLRTHGFAVREYPSAEALLGAPELPEEACLLLDLRMPGASGLELQEALARRAPHLAVVFLTGHGDLPTGVRAMKAGAVDFLEKPAEPEALLSAVDRALEHATNSSRARRERERLADRFAGLTPREREVLAHLLEGRLNKQIAAALGIVERTVKVHRARVMEKTGVASVAELVRLAARAGAA